MTESEKMDLYLAGLHDGMRRVVEAVREAFPFPFKASAADRDDILGPFCINGVERDEEQERVERIVGHYLLTARGEAANVLTHSFLHLYDVNGGMARTGERYAPTHPLHAMSNDALRERLREYLRQRDSERKSESEAAQ